jgi:hypothetical protein
VVDKILNGTKINQKNINLLAVQAEKYAEKDVS